LEKELPAAGKEKENMTYAERFPRFAKEKNPAIRAWYYSLAHLWIYMKSGVFPPNLEDMPPHVAKMCERIGEFSGNPNERMFIFPVGKAKAYYRDPETGEDTLIDDPWSVIYEYVEASSHIAGVNYDYCRESGVGSFEEGQSCYCDGITCSNYIGEASTTGFPEATYQMTKEEFLAKLKKVKELGTLLLDFGYGPPDTPAYDIFPTTRAIVLGCCPHTRAGSYEALWRPIVDSVGHNNSLFTAEIDRNKCTGCGRCAMHCGQNIIAYEKGSGRAYIESTQYCMGCGRCQLGCQEGAIKLIAQKPDINAYVHQELDCRVSVTTEPPIYDPEITPTLPHGEHADMSWWEENWDVDKLYQEWLAARGEKSNL